MSRKYTAIKVINIIFSIFYIIIGVTELLSGATEDSRFYYIDNIFIRIIGVLFIIASIGLLLKNQISRKGIMILCIISVLEVIITFDYNYPMLDQVLTFLTTGLIYGVPLVFLSRRRVKEYYTSKGKVLDNEAGEIESFEANNKALKKHSRLGIASFVLSIINLFIWIILIITSVMRLLDNSVEGGIIMFSPLTLIIGFTYVIVIVSSFTGLGLGIAGLFTKNTKKTYVIWGTVLNGLLVIIFLLILIGGLFNYNHGGLYNL